MRPLLLSTLLFTGCAHRGLSFPGPTTSLGSEPGRYVPTPVDDRSDEADDELGSGGQQAVASARRSRRNKPGSEVAEQAERLLGDRRLRVDGEAFRYDCSGLVEAAYYGAGCDLRGSTASMYEQARDAGLLHKKKVPRPGDVAFFDNTHDRNKNGRRDDELTHVAIVESVDAFDTITLVHLGGDGVVRIQMNLREPHEHTAPDGTMLNSYLRSGRDDGGDRLSGELFRAFASLWELEPSVADVAQESSS